MVTTTPPLGHPPCPLAYTSRDAPPSGHPQAGTLLPPALICSTPSTTNSISPLLPSNVLHPGPMSLSSEDDDEDSLNYGQGVLLAKDVGKLRSEEKEEIKSTMVLYGIDNLNGKRAGEPTNGILKLEKSQNDVGSMENASPAGFPARKATPATLPAGVRPKHAGQGDGAVTSSWSHAPLHSPSQESHESPLPLLVEQSLAKPKVLRTLAKSGDLAALEGALDCDEHTFPKSLGPLDSSSLGKEQNSFLNNMKPNQPQVASLHISNFPSIAHSFETKAHGAHPPILDQLAGQSKPNSPSSPVAKLSSHATSTNSKPMLSSHGITPPKWVNPLRHTQPNMSLSFVNPEINEDGALKLKVGASKEGEDLWKNTIVGYSIDRKLPFKALSRRVLALWGSLGLKDIRANREGFYFFSFQSGEGVSQVLNKGPWIILGQHLVLKRWSRSFDFRKEVFRAIPNWIKLFGIPTTYWYPIVCGRDNIVG